ncbi:hypothetical protein [Achromobacter sp.]|uniref:hypothetical protein n=1 Tax=Achromobacter sp. TaxID=134375 RepID=UPI0028B10CA5|nr:hypothetical protein [Achromobacter sp.]
MDDPQKEQKSEGTCPEGSKLQKQKRVSGALLQFMQKTTLRRGSGPGISSRATYSAKLKTGQMLGNRASPGKLSAKPSDRQNSEKPTISSSFPCLVKQLRRTAVDAYVPPCG